MITGINWEEIKKDLKYKKNANEVYDILSSIQSDVFYQDEDGKRVFTTQEEKAIEKLVKLGEDKIAKIWV